MKMSERLYRLIVRLNRSQRANFLKAQMLRIRRLILMISDPVVRMPINESGKELWMRLSHSLPLLRSSSAFYDAIFERLAQNAIDFDANLTMIDVGANVGDTISLIGHNDNCKFLCIEGDRRHFVFLERNTQFLPNVTSVCAILSDSNDLHSYRLQGRHGTSHIISGGSQEARTRTVDDIVEEYRDFQRANLLKIDTDGYDLKVMRGAVRLLSDSKPAIIFELAPRYYAKIGGDDPKLALQFLRSVKYDLIAVYSSAGLLMLSTDIGDESALSVVQQLVDYAHFEGRYFDVVAFHRSEVMRYDAFLKGERALFAPPDPAQYDLA